MPTFIDELDELTDALADWAEEQVDIIVDALAPDGRPYSTKRLTNQERISEYMLIRDNPQSWQQWVLDKANQITEQLMASQVEPALIESVHPVDIALHYAIKYSYDMERLLDRYMNSRLPEDANA